MSERVRMGAWTPEEDAVLAQIVIDEVRKGKTQVTAFKRVARELNRTPQACSFRFNNTMRPLFLEELKQAKKEAKFKAREIPSIKVEEESDERKEVLLEWERLLAERESRLHKGELEQKANAHPEHFATPMGREVGAVEFKTEQEVESLLNALDKSTPVIAGVSADEPRVTNAKGGSQSASLYRMDLLDPKALLATAKVLKEGADKYGAENWRLIDVEDHLNHLIIHAYAYLAGDESDEHLSHVTCRALFALGVKLQTGKDLDKLKQQGE